jgi:hypothetical protein
MMTSPLVVNDGAGASSKTINYQGIFIPCGSAHCRIYYLGPSTESSASHCLAPFAWNPIHLIVL